MPVHKKMMEQMMKQYGASKGRDVYYAMEQKKKKKQAKKEKKK